MCCLTYTFILPISWLSVTPVDTVKRLMLGHWVNATPNSRGHWAGCEQLSKMFCLCSSLSSVYHKLNVCNAAVHTLHEHGRMPQEKSILTLWSPLTQLCFCLFASDYPFFWFLFWYLYQPTPYSSPISWFCFPSLSIPISHHYSHIVCALAFYFSIFWALAESGSTFLSWLISGPFLFKFLCSTYCPIISFKFLITFWFFLVSNHFATSLGWFSCQKALSLK